MSLKAIEMQIVIPRTTEASALQNQLNQKPEQDQATLAAMMARRIEEQRQKTVKVDDTSDMHVREENADNKRGQERSHNNSKGQKSEDERLHHNVHPYKGQHIDLSM